MRQINPDDFVIIRIWEAKFKGKSKKTSVALFKAQIAPNKDKERWGEDLLSVGHASLETKTEYMSFWPSSTVGFETGGLVDPVNGACQTKMQDYVAEGKKLPDKTIILFGLEGQQISDEIKKWKEKVNECARANSMSQKDALEKGIDYILFANSSLVKKRDPNKLSCNCSVCVYKLLDEPGGLSQQYGIDIGSIDNITSLSPTKLGEYIEMAKLQEIRDNIHIDLPNINSYLLPGESIYAPHYSQKKMGCLIV